MYPEGQMSGSPIPNEGRISELAMARLIQTAVRQVPGVHDLAPGGVVEAATYGPGEKVRGVIVRTAGGVLAVELHLTATYSDRLVLPELAERVRHATQEAASSNEALPISYIDVVVEDLWIGAVPEE